MTSYHTRKEHPRTNSTGTVSNVRATVVQTEGSATHLDQETIKSHTDSLHALAEEDFVFADEFEEYEEVPEDEVELSPKDRQDTANLLNNLIKEGRSVADSSGKLIEEQLPYLLTLKGLIERLEVELEDEGEVDDIVFALESPEWTEHDFTRAESIPWLALGVEPQNAAAWKAEGYTPYNVGKWINNNRYYGRVEPKDAKWYDMVELEFYEATQWSSREFTGEEAVGFIKGGIDLYEADRWRSAGAKTIKEKEDWNALGITIPQQVKVLTTLGDAAATEWSDLDADLNEAIPWEEFVGGIYTRESLAPYVKGESPIEPMVFQKWHEVGVPAEQIYDFIKKGYTPKRSLTRIKRGQTGATADDLCKGELVPGKAWPEIKAAIHKNASDNNRKVQIRNERVSGTGNVRIIVEMEKEEGSDYDRAKSYRINFTNTGRFISAGGSHIYRGEIRKVSDFAAALGW